MDLNLMLGPILIFIAIVLVLLIIITGYVKAPPDKAFIISGLKERTIIGKAGIKIPFLERKDILDLKLMSIDIRTTSPVPTADYINIRVDAVANVKISSESEKLKVAGQNFLNQNTTYISQIAQQVLEGNTREIIGSMNLQEVIKDRQKFAELVKQNAAPDLAAMGLDVVNFNVQNFSDENGVIDALGVENETQIRKAASISKAEGERDIAMAQSDADRRANEARIKSQTDIATKNNELAVKQAELKAIADSKKAEADAAYEIQKEEQRKTIEITTANANIAKQEKEILLKEKEAEIMERALDASIKKKADADKYAAQLNADAILYQKQRDAEAEKYQATQQAEALKIKADADRYAKEQEAVAIRQKGLAEAEAIKAKLLAEAEGTDKKAEAMRKMGEAAVLEMYFNALPAVVKNAAEPLMNVDKITMYGEGNSSKMVKDIIGTVSQVTDGLKESTGVDLQALLAGFMGGKMSNESNDILVNIDVNEKDKDNETTEETKELIQ